MTSFIFNVRNLPAALYKALGGFATNGVNMTKLESYMVGGEFTATQFLAEVDGHPDDVGVKNALEELAFFTTEVKILGRLPGGRASGAEPSSDGFCMRANMPPCGSARNAIRPTVRDVERRRSTTLPPSSIACATVSSTLLDVEVDVPVRRDRLGHRRHRPATDGRRRVIVQ